jgi:hypothetical protein
MRTYRAELCEWLERVGVRSWVRFLSPFSPLSRTKLTLLTFLSSFRYDLQRGRLCAYLSLSLLYDRSCLSERTVVNPISPSQVSAGGSSGGACGTCAVETAGGCG